MDLFNSKHIHIEWQLEQNKLDLIGSFAQSVLNLQTAAKKRGVIFWQIIYFI